MIARATLLALAAIASPSTIGAARAEDAAAWIERLSSKSADERLVAERWLAIHLGEGDLPLVVEAARGSDAEAEHRLVRALGSSERHVDLLARLLASDAPSARELGRAALDESLRRWAPAIDRPPLLRDELHELLVDLRERSARPVLGIETQGSLPQVLDRLARLADVPCAFAIDPEVDARPPPARSLERLEGTFEDLVFGIAAVYRVGIEGFLREVEGDERELAFVHVLPSGQEGVERAPERIASWFGALESAPDLAVRSSAARALAGCGWPDALLELERRWTTDGDLRALDGLVLAAGRGRSVGALARPDAVRELAGTADRGLGARNPTLLRRAHGIVHALGAGGALAGDGTNLARIVAEGLPGGDDAARWGRLVVLEAMQSGDERVRAAVAAELAREPSPESSGVPGQALRAWVALPRVAGEEVAPPPIETPTIALLLSELGRLADAREIARLLARASVPLPEAWRDPAALPAEVGDLGRVAVLEWALARGETPTAARHLVALGVAEGAWPETPRAPGATEGPREVPRTYLVHALVGHVLHHWVRQGEAERAAACIEAARAAAAGAAEGVTPLDRVAVVAGVADAARQREVHEHLEAEGLRDVVARGSLAGGPWREARQALLAALDEAISGETDPLYLQEVARAFERYLDDCLASGRDVLAESTVGDVLSRARSRASDPAVARLFLARRWPPPPRLEIRDLEVLDRRLRPSLW